MPRRKKDPDLPALEKRLRILIYRQFVHKQRAPTLAEMAKTLSRPLLEIRAAVERLGQSHAIVPQENGELWRAESANPVEEGKPVRVLRVQGLKLYVEPADVAVSALK